jgi:hypothetical protein
LNFLLPRLNSFFRSCVRSCRPLLLSPIRGPIHSDCFFLWARLHAVLSTLFLSDGWLVRRNYHFFCINPTYFLSERLDRLPPSGFRLPSLLPRLPQQVPLLRFLLPLLLPLLLLLTSLLFLQMLRDCGCGFILQFASTSYSNSSIRSPL